MQGPAACTFTPFTTRQLCHGSLICDEIATASGGRLVVRLRRGAHRAGHFVRRKALQGLYDHEAGLAAEKVASHVARRRPAPLIFSRHARPHGQPLVRRGDDTSCPNY